MNLSIPMKQNVVTGLAPVSTNTAKTAEYLNMGLALRVYVIATLTQAVGNATALTLRQAQDNTGSGLKDLGNMIPVWAAEDIDTSEILEKQDDGYAYTVGADANNKKIVFQVDGEDMDVKNGFTHLTVQVGASGQNGNLINIEYLVEARTPGASLT